MVIYLFIIKKTVSYSPGYPLPYYVAEFGLDHNILLLPILVNWRYKHMPPYKLQEVFEIWASKCSFGW